MKIIDRYLLKTYLITFTSVFVILFFIFILQTVWLFISELAGKDLDIVMIFKFLAFASPKLVPMVLPLTVLLASIMTFGDLAENYEFAAMKSAGISFQRTLKMLSVFILLLSLCAFFFANNVIPYAEYKFTNFRKNLAQVKPALAITEGQFSTIGDINIKVNKKSGEKGEFLEGIIIHKKSPIGEGAKTVIKSKNGVLISSEESNLLQLVLKDGYYYEDVTPKNFQDRDKVPFAKANFKTYNINIDLSKLNQTNNNDTPISASYMLSLTELKYSLDSVSTAYNKEVISVSDNMYNRFGFQNIYVVDSLLPKKTKVIDLMKLFTSNDEKSKVLEIALSDVNSSVQNIEMNNLMLLARKKDINEHWLCIYDKFVIGLASILMFFIGAPLGAIIRKGGLGLPIVFAMVIFISFHFINSFTRRMAAEGEISPFFGNWTSTLILLPLAIYLTKVAVQDNGGVNFSWLTMPIVNFFSRKKALNISDVLKPVDLDRVVINEDDNEWIELNTFSTTRLIEIVKNYRQFDFSIDYRKKAIKILDERGVSQEELILSNNFVNLEYQELEEQIFDFNYFSKMALILNVISFVLIFIGLSNLKILLVVITFLILILFYILNYKAQNALNLISKISQKELPIGLATSLLIGFPFYIFVFSYNKKYLKEVLKEFN